MAPSVYGIVYLVTCLVSGKHYVGQTTTTLSRRWKQHQAASKRGVDYPLYRAIRAHGSEAFQVILLEECRDAPHLHEAEIRQIAKYDSFRSGYNCSTGGLGGTPSSAVRTKISLSQKARLKDPELRKKMSELAKDAWGDPAYRESASVRTKSQFSDPLQREQLSKKQKAWFASHPERRNDLKEYNKTPEARQAKSRLRLRYFQDHPEARTRLRELRKCLEISKKGYSKEDLLLGLLAQKGEMLISELVTTTGLSKTQVWEGLDRYQASGRVQSRRLNPGECAELKGSSRSRTKVWSLCS